jgi:8-oxo-dGTP pyrophosphatase MutT (NUDIX family)
MNDYISELREKIGHQKFIHPGARILVESDRKEFLFIHRNDNGNLGIPAGSIEENETIEECIIREVKEETGVEILSLEVIGISSNPSRETVSYPNGDQIQYFTIEFYSNHWKGELLVNDTKEIKEAQFHNASYLDKLPNNEKLIVESLNYFRNTGKILLK